MWKRSDARSPEAGATGPSITPFPAEATEAASTARVVVAEADPVTRAAIRRALEDHGFEVCAVADDAASAVEASERERPDVCLLDADLPGGPLDAVRAVASRLPAAAVVMLTPSRDDPRLFDGLCAGASGSVPKDVDPARLALTLQVVLDGDVRFPRAVVAALVAESRVGARSESAPGARQSAGAALTKREREVLELLREGRTTAEVAAHLFISKVTVRSHVCALVRKLGVPDRDAAIRRFEGGMAFRENPDD